MRYRAIFGIPSVWRPAKNYVVETVGSLFAKLPESARDQVSIVVLNANVVPEQHLEIGRLKQRHARELASGLLQIVEIPAAHPQLGPYADAPGGAFGPWAAKMVLDAAYLMEFCRPQAEYYVHLEDDVIAAANYWPLMDQWMTRYVGRDDWLMLSFYTPWGVADGQEYALENFYGFIGQLFRSRDLDGLVAYLRRRFADQSAADWLVRDYAIETGRKVYVRQPSLFQHVGFLSSLDSGVQRGRAYAFADDPLPRNLRRLLRRLQAQFLEASWGRSRDKH